MSVTAVLLTGGLASGKTAVAVELGEILGERGTPHAVVDLDWLCWAGPDLDGTAVHGLLTANLRAVTAEYRKAGIDRFVLARALLEPAHLAAVRAGLTVGAAAPYLTVVRLTVSRETAVARLRGRDSGANLAAHLGEVDGFAARVARAGVEDHVVVNEGRSLREVASEVLEHAGLTRSPTSG
ncbi:hypothetical protein [Rhizohabitans arisaemae]|uniref:hypothetical protein n=1 Tax=Rhizohabitans arisaemae TaxID=2720610 RepID=UPI0024B2395C|nr:hypothetical protein [Rhizohabitans arisaemae]